MEQAGVQGTLIQISRSRGGMPKRAIEGPAMIGPEGVEGDRHFNTRVHGGPNKAVLVISAEILQSMAAQGFPVYPGALGENLTVAGMDPHCWRQGQRYRVGHEIVIELTQLRTPCTNVEVYGPDIKAEMYDLACSRGDVRSPKWAHGGFYARVIRSGFVSAGEAMVLESETC
jgi:MOSC domain-containing protein YiiM